MNNVLLVAAMAVILLGTLYPIFLDAFDLRGVSVGPPYFSTMFLVPMLPLVFLLAPGMHAAWKRASFERTKVLLAVLLLVAIVLGIGIPAFAYGWRSVLSAVGIVVAVGRARIADRAGRAIAQGPFIVGGRARHERRALRPGDVHSRHDRRVLQTGEGSELAPGPEHRGRRVHVRDEQPARRPGRTTSVESEWSSRATARNSRSCIRRSASTACRRTR